MRPIHRPVTLLNHPIYQDPDGEHAYSLGPGPYRKDFHDPGCPKVKGIEGVSEVTSTYDRLFTATCMPCKHCIPHGAHKVTLPDGTYRYRPMGPIAVGHHGDRVEEHGEYALCDQSRGKWRVREWAADGPAALARAKELGVKVILGPLDARYGLPIGPESQ
ncbi:hypothetical protein [Nonomuraea basaltis]|uniref:hypothetical protein n=1 Tax=Nonomuraea basaltis TaxID=2495887 RepID=UPI00110C596D|nr:hypothetical protein [Nonomuraea basaltis]TMR92817.1 hypothetical protein EJK15_42440 [Nonomuraea basaltis]